MIPDNEALFDREIVPLVNQIACLAKERGLPFVACFQVAGEKGGDADAAGARFSTLAYLPEGAAARLAGALLILCPPEERETAVRERLG